MHPYAWHSESDEPTPERLTPVDDRLTADAALKRLRRGEYLLYTGDFHNAKQLLAALSRRLARGSTSRTPLDAFRAERQTRQLEHDILSRVVVSLDRGYRLALARAPDVAEACRWVWGEATLDATVVSLKTLLGMLGSAEWRRKGLTVPGLKGRLHPHYGVYLPTRTDYIELLRTMGPVTARRVFDVGTGTGVLAFLLLQQGASTALATDVDARAVTCAKDNAERLGLAERFEAIERDLFPEGKADLVVCNPPWIPEPPKNRVDRAVFDPESQFLKRFLEELPHHLEDGGRGLLLLSDLAVLLGLRSADWLPEQLARAGLHVVSTRSVTAHHAKAKDQSDPLHAARSREVTTLYVLAPGANPG